jgi:hypothetical protein
VQVYGSVATLTAHAMSRLICEHALAKGFTERTSPID